MKFYSIFFCFFCFLLLSEVSSASGGVTDKKLLEMEISNIEKKCKSERNCGEEDIEKLKKSISSLGSLSEKFKFGVAIGFENYKDKYISEVETVGGDRVVRVVESQEYKPSVWLETHYVWDGIASGWGFTHSAPGFYVGARLLGPESDVFEAFSLGAMWSFKRTALGMLPPAGQIAESINIGIGPVWHKTKKLSYGISEGEVLPENFNDVKLDKRDEVSWMLMISAGF